MTTKQEKDMTALFTIHVVALPLSGFSQSYKTDLQGA